jgi:hypothetical protein
VKKGFMNEEDRAVFVRIVLATEELLSLAKDAKALTWETAREHAVLQIEDGRRIMVCGGTYGIELEQAAPNDPFGRPVHSLWVSIEDQPVRVMKLILHTHPLVTGPSDDDLRILQQLGQSESYLFEIFGPDEGTIIRPKAGKR